MLNVSWSLVSHVRLFPPSTQKARLLLEIFYPYAPWYQWNSLIAQGSSMCFTGHWILQRKDTWSVIRGGKRQPVVLGEELSSTQTSVLQSLNVHIVDFLCIFHFLTVSIIVFQLHLLLRFTSHMDSDCASTVSSNEEYLLHLDIILMNTFCYIPFQRFLSLSLRRLFL